jgi:prophage regulatory protein
MNQLLRLPQVMNRVGLRPTRIYELMGDGSFPKPIRLGERAVAWLESEVDAWIVAQAQKPRVEIRTSSGRRKRAEAAAA